VSNGNGLRIHFEKEIITANKKGGSASAPQVQAQEAWELVTYSSQEKKKLVLALCKRWKEMFKLDLTVSKPPAKK
jgi:hypothetical protein